MEFNITQLNGKIVRLELLSMSHLEGLQHAVQDGSLWELWFTIVPKAEDMRQEIVRRLMLYQEKNMLRVINLFEVVYKDFHQAN